MFYPLRVDAVLCRALGLLRTASVQMKHARKDEAEDMASYEKLRTESQASLTALEEKKVRP